jgi:hypothetical protein
MWRSKVKNQNLQDQRLKNSRAEENKTLADFAPAKPLLLPSLLASSEPFFSHTARLFLVQTLATLLPCSWLIYSVFLLYKIKKKINI